MDLVKNEQVTKQNFQIWTICSLIQKNGYTFAIVYSNKYVSNFLNQTLHDFITLGFAENGNLLIRKALKN